MKRLIFVLLLCPSVAYAGILNTLPDIPSDSKEDLKVKLGLGANWQTGNNDVLNISSAGSVYYNKNNGLNIYAISRYSRNGSASGKNINGHSVLTHFRLRYLRTIGAEFFAQHEFDKFRNLDARVLVGFGPIFRLIKGEDLNIILGTSFMFEHLNWHKPNHYEYNERSSNYIQIELIKSSILTLQDSIFFQFKFYDPKDYLTLNNLSIEVKILDWLSINTMCTVAYDSRPPFGIKKLDTTLMTGVVINYEHKQKEN